MSLLMFFKKKNWLILESSQNQLITDRYIINNELSLIEPRTWNNKAQGAKGPERSRSIFPGSNTINRMFCPFTGSFSFAANSEVSLISTRDFIHLIFCHFPLSYLRVILSFPSWILLLTHLGTPPAFSGVWRHLIN